MMQNNIIVEGIVSDSYYSHTFNNVNYFVIYLSVAKNEDCSIFKIIISEDNACYNPILLKKGLILRVKGHIYSNSNNENFNIFIYGLNAVIISDEDYYSSSHGRRNLVSIEGIICKKVYNHHFMKTNVSSSVIVCNRSNSKKSDYIPIYSSNELYKIMSKKQIGDKLKIYGYLQERAILQKNVERRIYEIVVLNVKELLRNTRVKGEIK